MKDIGIQFLEAREEIGITKEEAIGDLGITMAQLDNLEDGNINAFKDIFFLKELIRKYSKYLNLDEDAIMNSFNDFVFDFTSRIPVAEIEEKVKELTKEEKENPERKIVSPYTNNKEIKRKLKPIVFYTLAFILVIIVAVAIILFIKNQVN